MHFAFFACQWSSITYNHESILDLLTNTLKSLSQHLIGSLSPLLPSYSFLLKQSKYFLNPPRLFVSSGTIPNPFSFLKMSARAFAGIPKQFAKAARFQR